VCQRAAVVVALLASHPAHRPETVPGAQPLQAGHQADVGGPGEQQGRPMGDTAAKEQDRAGLGECLHGDARRAVPRRRRDMRNRATDEISGESLRSITKPLLGKPCRDTLGVLPT